MTKHIDDARNLTRKLSVRNTRFPINVDGTPQATLKPSRVDDSPCCVVIASADPHQARFQLEGGLPAPDPCSPVEFEIAVKQQDRGRFWPCTHRKSLISHDCLLSGQGGCRPPSSNGCRCCKRKASRNPGAVHSRLDGSTPSAERLPEPAGSAGSSAKHRNRWAGRAGTDTSTEP